MKKVLAVLSILSILITLLAFTPVPVFAATNPTVVASTISNGTTAGTSLTLPLTVPSGNQNNVLVVFFSSETGGLTLTVKYNGVSMTKGTAGGTVFNFQSEYYYLAAPTVGANNIVVTWAGSAPNIGVAAVVLKDAFQGAPETDAYLGQNTAASITRTLTTTNNNDLILTWVAMNQGGTSLTPSGSQVTEVSSKTLGTNSFFGNVSSLPLPTAGAQAVGAAFVPNETADEIAAAFKYVAPAATSVPAADLLTFFRWIF